TSRDWVGLDADHFRSALSCALELIGAEPLKQLPVVSVCPRRWSGLVKGGMRTQRYPSDLTDQQWALVEPLIPVYPGGRPRKTSMRDVLDAILYLLRTGCQWRYLPKDFPPKSTVWGYFDEWRHNGTLE